MASTPQNPYIARSSGWAPWVLFLFVTATLGLTALGASVALGAQQFGTLLLGLIGAAVGVMFLLNAPGWSRQSRG